MGSHSAFSVDGMSLDPINTFPPRPSTSVLSNDYSDFSEASTASELDDSTQNNDSARSAQSAHGDLFGSFAGSRFSRTIDIDLSDLLSSPLIDCHVERPNERD
jgi:hypothetical protein